MTLEDKLHLSGHTDAGRVRAHNEDSIFVDRENGLAVLADGMGGYKAGEVASSIAVNTIRDFVAPRLDATDDEPADDGTGLMRASILLRDGVRYANETVNVTARNDPECEGMGTTVAAMVFYDGQASVAHVGDSRGYRLRDGALEQLTSDHSLREELITRGFYTREEADVSLNRNVVTRALGIDPEVEVTITETDARPGDIFLLCSDGLNDMIDDETIRLTLNTSDASLDTIVTRLIAAANDSGGRDNISVILAHVVEPLAGQRDWLSATSESPR